jgi:hypothetical protein
MPADPKRRPMPASRGALSQRLTVIVIGVKRPEQHWLGRRDLVDELSQIGIRPCVRQSDVEGFDVFELL